MVRALGLTDQQVRRFDAYVEARNRELSVTTQKLLEARADLDKMTRERVVDLATYSFQATLYHALLGVLRQNVTLIAYHLYRQLTPEQYRRLKAIEARRFGGPRQ